MSKDLKTIVVNRNPHSDKIHMNVGHSPFIGPYISDEERWNQREEKRKNNLQQQ